MKLSGNKIQADFNPLLLSGNLNVTGGSVVQFFDGVDYYPNRAGSPASPILIEHAASVINPDEDVTGAIAVTLSTLWYEDGEPVTSSTPGYELIGSSLKVIKNIPAGTSVEIRAVTSFVDGRTGKTYSREDITYLRTIIKSEAPYQVLLTPQGSVFFDGYRNPNTTADISAKVMQGDEEVTDLAGSGIELRWLNSAGEDVMENELYADTLSPDWRTLTIDKTYIDKDLIRCEAWKGEELAGFGTVTFVRKFGSIRTDVRIPQNPLLPGVTHLSCSVLIRDMLGNIDVDAAFLVKWIVSEAGVEKEVGTGANIRVPVSSINLKAANLDIYPDIRRREAFAALTGVDELNDEVLYTDDEDNVLTVETFGL